MNNKIPTVKQRALWGFLFIGSDLVRLEQFSRIFACVDQCLDLIYHFLTVFRIGDTEPFAGGIQYFDRSRLVKNIKIKSMKIVNK